MREVTKALKIGVLLHPLLRYDNSHRSNRTRSSKYGFIGTDLSLLVNYPRHGRSRREGTLCGCIETRSGNAEKGF